MENDLDSFGQYWEKLVNFLFHHLVTLFGAPLCHLTAVMLQVITFVKSTSYVSSFKPHLVASLESSNV